MNFKKIFFLIVFLFLGIFGYRYFFKNKTNILLKDDKKEKNLYLVNVLDKETFDDANIKGSINVDFENVSSFLNDIKNKNVPIVFYCANYYCTASDEAALMAYKKGFENVYLYKGGMAEWYKASKNDPSYLYNGPARLEYLQIVIPFENEKEDVNTFDSVTKKNKYEILTTQKLKDLLIENKIL